MHIIVAIVCCIHACNTRLSCRLALDVAPLYDLAQCLKLVRYYTNCSDYIAYEAEPCSCIAVILCNLCCTRLTFGRPPRYHTA